ncbi:MAG: NAD(P)H-dependent oxidoreductase [Spirochaetales bacterium]|nr:NAD(P)H-dependent oxidoreductase [Spirochaetales bacterium]
MKEKKEEILKAYKFRRAIKEFEPDKKISDDDFNFILETTRLSPSSFGWEPWKFVVIQNKDLRKKLMEPSWGAQRQLPSASHFVVILARKAVDMTPGSEYLSYISDEIDGLPEEMKLEKEKFFGNFQQNEFDLTDERKIFDWSSRQVYLPFANMMTAAAQIGIDSCPIEGFDKEKVEEILSAEGVLDKEHLGVAAMAAFGYRKADSPFPGTRQPMEKIVEWVR